MAALAGRFLDLTKVQIANVDISPDELSSGRVPSLMPDVLAIDLSVARTEWTQIWPPGGGQGLAFGYKVVNKGFGPTVEAVFNSTNSTRTYDLTIWGGLPGRFSKMFIKNSAQAGKILYVAVIIDPSLLPVLFPEASLGMVGIANTSGTPINPATEDTLAAGIKVKNSSGTVINPARDENLQTLISQGANRTSGFSKQYIVGTTVVTGDNQAVPEGFPVLIYADADNTGEVAFTLDGTTTPVIGTHASLKKGQGIEVKITNINKLKFIATASGQKVNVVVEV